MIDLHSHVLPGMDDGPAELDGSIALAEAAARDGTRVLAATPHARADHATRVEDIAGECERVQRSLPAAVDITLVPGAEVDVLWARAASPEKLRLASYGQRGTDLLVETPYALLPASFEDVLFSFSAQGFRLMLAHPERNPSFQRDGGRLAELVRRGVLVQITTPALTTSSRSSRSRRLALALIREGLAHVIASDAHSAESPRPPGLSAAVAVAADVDPLRARWMVEDAPAAILAGEALPAAPTGTPKKRRRRLRLRRKE